MKLFVGLGNPGTDYVRHRHNIGFLALDEIAQRHRYPPWRNKYRGEFADGTIAGERVLLLKPQTFMNRSGQAVAEAAKFYKILLQDVVVFHDELDLAPAKLRVKLDGGVAGHNGLRSIDQCLGSKAFKRVRLGIGHPGQRDKVTGYVLGNFAKSDQDWLAKLLTAIGEYAGLLAAGKDSDFMSKIASTLNPPKVRELPKAGNSGAAVTDRPAVAKAEKASR